MITSTAATKPTRRPTLNPTTRLDSNLIINVFLHLLPLLWSPAVSTPAGFLFVLSVCGALLLRPRFPIVIVVHRMARVAGPSFRARAKASLARWAKWRENKEPGQ
jgi:hypothetical protein